MSHLVLDECCLAPLVPNETLLALWHLDRNGWPSLKVCATRHSLHRRSKGLRRPFTTATCWEGNKRDVSTRASTRRHGSSQMVFSFWFFFFFPVTPQHLVKIWEGAVKNSRLILHWMRLNSPSRNWNVWNFHGNKAGIYKLGSLAPSIIMTKRAKCHSSTANYAQCRRWSARARRATCIPTSHARMISRLGNKAGVLPRVVRKKSMNEMFKPCYVPHWHEVCV